MAKKPTPRPRTMVMLVIQPDGSQVETRMSKSPTLDQLQAAVDGYVEDVTRYCHYARTANIYVNEEARHQDMTPNVEGTKLVGYLGDILLGPICVVWADYGPLEPVTKQS